MISTTESSDAMPIGNAAGESDEDYSLQIYDAASVKAGSAKSSAALQMKANRVPSCQNRSNNWVKIEKCQHEGCDFTIVDTWTHKVNCPYCGLNGIENHNIVDGKCVQCGFDGYDITFDRGRYGEGTMASVHLDPGIDEYSLPLCEFSHPEDQYFAEWEINIGSKVSSGVPGETIKSITSDIKLVATWYNKPLYVVMIDKNIAHGTVEIAPYGVSVEKGTEIWVTASPDEGYELYSLTYTPLNGGSPVAITEKDDFGHYIFEMPADYVTVSAVFKTDAEAVTAVTIDPTSLELEEGDSAALTATVEPESAANKNVTWSSSNESVVTVDENGKVTAVAEGTATITVKTEDGGKTAECLVTVKAAPHEDVFYRNTEGDGSVWYKGSGKDCVFIFKRSVDDDVTFSHFEGIQIDGQEVGKENYDAVSGSVVITLKAAYMETLSNGKHTMTTLFDDADAVDVEFTIEAEETPSGTDDESEPDKTPGTGDESEPNKTPGTGDENDLFLWLILMAHP